CDDRRNREEILEILCRSQYIGSAPEYTRPGFIDPYNWGTEASPQMLLNYNQFYTDKTNYPDRVDALWTIAQMARWGIVPFPKNWVEVLDRIQRIDVFGTAARDLGLLDIGRDRSVLRLPDGTVFNADDPIAYLNRLEIKRDFRIEEVVMDSPVVAAA
ncbi:MAG: bacitracin ABC transporter ATP-binding protein, partial [Leptolyngbyaceae cyanobacterium bins.59]|nr:bacitracin ABC transporter ATP-binding protein [Leptolyngbyaceae cyanobacterium bins.59]